MDDIPKHFGRYHILKKLAQGGMGAVYLAHDTQLDRRVALKIPRFTPEDGPEVLERFQREARAAAMLNHPNICPIYDVGQYNGIHYLTMAYIEGRSLAESIPRNKRLPQKPAATIVRKVALALEEAHARGVVHRDLKPHNIMMNQRGEPIITDFGLARRATSTDHRLTKTGILLGTPAYMPPEQVRGDVKAMGPGCDIYSLGVVTYELLTGRLPFEGPLQSVLVQILMEEPEPPSKHRPDLDLELERICLRAMAKSAEDRYQTMTEFASDLEHYLQATEELVPNDIPARNVFAHTRSVQLLVRVTTWAYVGALLGALMGAVGGSMTYFQKKSDALGREAEALRGEEDKLKNEEGALQPANRQRIVDSEEYFFRHCMTLMNVCGNRQQPRG